MDLTTNDLRQLQALRDNARTSPPLPRLLRQRELVAALTPAARHWWTTSTPSLIDLELRRPRLEALAPSAEKKPKTPKTPKNNEQDLPPAPGEPDPLAD